MDPHMRFLSQLWCRGSCECAHRLPDSRAGADFPDRRIFSGRSLRMRLAANLLDRVERLYFAWLTPCRRRIGKVGPCFVEGPGCGTDGAPPSMSRSGAPGFTDIARKRGNRTMPLFPVLHIEYPTNGFCLERVPQFVAQVKQRGAGRAFFHLIPAESLPLAFESKL